MRLTLCFELKEQLRRLEARATRLREKLTSPSTARYDSMPRSSTRPTDEIARLTTKLLDVQGLIVLKREEMEAAQIELAEQIDERVADEFGSTVLLLRYVTCLTWSDVAKKLGASRRKLFFERVAWEAEYNEAEQAQPCADVYMKEFCKAFKTGG